MTLYSTPEGVARYTKMASEYGDGRDLIATLVKHLPPPASVLELGSGPGADLRILARHYAATGSDSSRAFIEAYSASAAAGGAEEEGEEEGRKVPEMRELDARTVEVAPGEKFDGIYSNKVLHHLERGELEDALRVHAQRVRDGGVVMHSFWSGDGEQEIEGMRFVYYHEGDMREMGERCGLRAEEVGAYSEMGEGDDSFFVVWRKLK